MRNFSKRVVIVLGAVFGLVAASPVMSQDLTADELLANMKQEAEETEDVTFLLTGRLIDADGTSINLEVDVELIPGERVARATFYQPDALADNVIVFADEAIYNYLFLTNQVTIFDANDPDALGGLLGGEGEGDEAGFEMTLDLDRLFAGWDATVEGYEDGAYTMRFDNREEGAALDHVLATVADGTWQPTDLVLFDGDGDALAELHIENFTRNTGLSAEDVSYIPEDAEVIDERG